MLKRLWSTTSLLQPVEFHPGLNLIIGRYSKERASSGKGGINGIGKSSLVRLIDFALLSDTAEKRFKLDRYEFLRAEGHDVSLLMEVAGESLAIRRTFSDTDTVYITRGYEGEHAYSRVDANRLLGSLFFPETPTRRLPGGRYRTLMQFFAKDDLAMQARKDPLTFLSHGGVTKLETIELNLFLLGLPNSALVTYGDLRELLNRKQEERDVVRDRIEEQTGKSLAELKTDSVSRDREVEVLQSALQRFDLSEDFRDVSGVVRDLEERIAALRTAVGQFDRQLAKLRRFTTATRELDSEDVAEQYRLVSNALGDAVKRNLDEVIAFRESLAQARLRFYGKQLEEIATARVRASEELAAYENERSSLLRSVQADRTAETVEGALERLIGRKVEADRVSNALADHAALEKEVAALVFDMEVAKRNSILAIDDAEALISDLRILFVEILDEAIGFSNEAERSGAFLDVSVNPTGGYRRIPVSIEVEVPKGDALGYTRLRVVAYESTVLLNAVKRDLTLPRFLIHDGALHGVARRTVVRFLNFMYREGEGTGGFQYIATFNEDELGVALDQEARDGHFEFDLKNQTIATVSDSVGGRLFGREFS